MPIVLFTAPAWADHGGPLAAAPMSPLGVVVVAGALAFLTVLLLLVIVRLLARPGRRTE